MEGWKAGREGCLELGADLLERFGNVEFDGGLDETAEFFFEEKGGTPSEISSMIAIVIFAIGVYFSRFLAVFKQVWAWTLYTIRWVSIVEVKMPNPWAWKTLCWFVGLECFDSGGFVIYLPHIFFIFILLKICFEVGF